MKPRKKRKSCLNAANKLFPAIGQNGIITNKEKAPWMKDMERFDFVNIINDNEELRSKNIFKGHYGVLISYINATDEWIVEVLMKHAMSPRNKIQFTTKEYNGNDRYFTRT